MNRELEERYLHLPLEIEAPVGSYSFKQGVEVQVKLDDDGLVVDAFMEGQSLGSTWKTYSEMGVEVNEIRKATPEALTESVLEDISNDLSDDENISS